MGVDRFWSRREHRSRFASSRSEVRGWCYLFTGCSADAAKRLRCSLQSRTGREPLRNVTFSLPVREMCSHKYMIIHNL